MKIRFILRAIHPEYTPIRHVRDFPLIIIDHEAKSARMFKTDEIMFSGARADSLKYNTISWKDYELKKL